MKTQPESAVHTPFTKRQPYQAATSTSSMLDVFLQDKGLPPSSSVSSSSSLPQQTTSSPHVAPPPASSLPKMAAVPSLGQQVSPSSSDAQGSSPLPLQQHKLKQQKKRTSITTKVTFKFKLQYFFQKFKMDSLQLLLRNVYIDPHEANLVKVTFEPPPKGKNSPCWICKSSCHDCFCFLYCAVIWYVWSDVLCVKINLWSLDPGFKKECLEQSIWANWKKNSLPHSLSQIPAMAVEMPCSTDISGLNLQFGALQFGSEPVLPEYESTPSTTTPANQVQNSLYTSPSRLVQPEIHLCEC